jgi:hypothetical protein
MKTKLKKIHQSSDSSVISRLNLERIDVVTKARAYLSPVRTNV